MSRANQKLPLLTFLTVLLPLLSATEAKADFYRCEYDGRVWVTNKVPAGQRRNCRLIMKTRVREEPAQEQAAASQAAPPAPRKRLAPHTPRVAGRAVFPEERLWAIVQEAAERYTIPEALILAVIKIESNFSPTAVSRVGAQGLMQLMPGTASDLGVTRPFDPHQNVMGGTRFLRQLANRFEGDIVRTLAGYHAGGGAVSRREGVPFTATEQYVRWVLDQYYRYRTLLEDPLQTSAQQRVEDETR